MQKNKQLKLFILVSIAAIFVAGCVTKPVVNQQPVNNQTTNKTTTTEGIDTSDWQIYQNDKIGFTIKYPSTWSCEDQLRTEISICKNIENIYSGTIPSVDVDVIMNTETNDPIKFLREKYNDSIFGIPIPEDYNYELADHKAIKINYTEGGNGFPVNEVIKIYLTVNEKLFIIDSHIDSKGLEKNIINTMLHTIYFM